MKIGSPDLNAEPLSNPGMVGEFECGHCGMEWRCLFHAASESLECPGCGYFVMIGVREWRMEREVESATSAQSPLLHW